MKPGRNKFAELPWWSRVPTLADIKYEPVNWLIEDFLPIASFMLLVGKPGTFKSWLALDLARAVALGQDFAQLKGGAAREVLYIDRENGSNLIAHRREVLGIPDTPKLRYWGRWVSLPFPGIGSNELVEYAEAVHPLIVFDSLVRFHHGNENDNSEMSAVMDGFVGLARKGATVVVLHHAGKESEKNFRGATEIEAAPDIACRVDRTSERTIKVRQFKNRLTEERSFGFTWTRFGFESSVPRKKPTG
jgi:hypothetical protein